MKKQYVIPDADAIQITLEWGVLQVHGTDEPITVDSTMEPDDYHGRSYDGTKQY